MLRQRDMLLGATAVAAAILLVAVPLLRNPVASELVAVQPAVATGDTAKVGHVGPLPKQAFGIKQQALRQSEAHAALRHAAKHRQAPRSASRLAAIPAAPRPVRKEEKVIAGKTIFARMVRVLGKVVKEQRSKAVKPAPKPPADLPRSSKFATKALKQALLQSLAAETVNEKGAIDVNGTNSQKHAIY